MKKKIIQFLTFSTIISTPVLAMSSSSGSSNQIDNKNFVDVRAQLENLKQLPDSRKTFKTSSSFTVSDKYENILGRPIILGMDKKIGLDHEPYSMIYNKVTSIDFVTNEDLNANIRVNYEFNKERKGKWFWDEVPRSEWGKNFKGKNYYFSSNPLDAYTYNLKNSSKFYNEYNKQISDIYSDKSKEIESYTSEIKLLSDSFIKRIKEKEPFKKEFCDPSYDGYYYDPGCRTDLFPRKVDYFNHPFHNNNGWEELYSDDVLNKEFIFWHNGSGKKEIHRLDNVEADIHTKINFNYKKEFFTTNLKYKELPNLISSFQNAFSSKNFINSFVYSSNGEKYSENNSNLKISNNALHLISDTMKSISSDEIQKFEGNENLNHRVSNKTKLDNIFSTIYTHNSNDFSIKYKFKWKKHDEKHINIFVEIQNILKDGKDVLPEIKNIDRNSFYKENLNNPHLFKKFFTVMDSLQSSNFLVYKNLFVNMTPSDSYKTYLGKNLGDNLIVSNNYFNSIGRIDSLEEYFNEHQNLDDFVRSEEPQKQDNKENEIKYKDKFFDGTYLIKNPVDLIFTSQESENDIMLINGEKVPVLNRKFIKKLQDKRKLIAGDKELKLDDSQSKKDKKENEYLVELLRYKKNSNNEGEPIQKFTRIYEIIDKKIDQSFKYYGWDPENNFEQKLLISPYLINEKGEKIKDKDNKLIPNKKYDKRINPNTGTKEQVIWLSNKMLGDFDLKDSLSFVYPNLSNSKKEDIDFGIFANSSVLGKGALRNFAIDEKFDDYVGYYKVKLFDKVGDRYVKVEKPNYEELSSESGNSQFSYMSEEGIWIVAAHIADNSFGFEEAESISNVSIVLIDENNSPDSLFLNQIKGKLYDKNNKPINDYFYVYTHGKNFISDTFVKYLLQNVKVPENELNYLPYDKVINYYRDYINYLSKFSLSDADDNIYKYDDLFSYPFVEWSELKNLNGLTYANEKDEKIINEYREKVKNQVLNYVYRNLRKSRELWKIGFKSNIDDGDWYIKEWNTKENTEAWLDEALNVVLFDSDNFNDYKGLEFTVSGKNKFSNQSKKFYLKNNAWNIFYPPIDLSVLNINKQFTIDIGANYSEDSKEVYKKINEEVLNIINKEFDSLENNKLKIDKDIFIENLDKSISKLVRGNKISKGVNLTVKGINANIHNQILINIKNIAAPPKFDLSLLNNVLSNNFVITSEGSIENLSQEIVDGAVEILKEYELEYKNDYLIALVSSKIYKLPLFVNDEELNKYSYTDKLNELFKKNKYISINGNKVVVPYEIKDQELKAKYENNIKLKVKEINDNNFVSQNNNIARWRIFTLVHGKDTKGFSSLGVINNINKNIVPNIKDIIDDNKDDPLKKENGDIHGQKLNGKNKITKKINYAIYITIGIFSIVLIIGSIYAIRYYLNRKGFKAGKSQKVMSRRNKKIKLRYIKMLISNFLMVY
ncbi:hypothetical protein JS510_02530 [Mycoplasma tauri]|nr:hypothetical protein [Mycoplasma tauri]QSB07365.1 hypothetical protein JS510_02530 [Mycoplasma tauri]